MKNKMIKFYLMTGVLLSSVGCSITNNSSISSQSNANDSASSTNRESSLSDYSSINSDISTNISDNLSNTSEDNEQRTLLSKEVYDYLTGSLKLENTTNYITSKLNDNGEYEVLSTYTEKNTVIYEDTEVSDVLGAYETYNPTERYENIFYNANGSVSDSYSYVMTTGKNVGTEAINLHNEVYSTPMIYDEGETTKWVTSIYQNLFTAFYSEDNQFTEKRFSTVDGVHYDLDKSFLIYGDMFFKSIFLTNGSSERFGIEVVDGIPVALYGSTYVSLEEATNKYYYLEYRAEISVDNVVTSRLQPYERKSYHDRIDNAINKALENNYTAVIDDGSMLATYKFTSDMMTVEVSEGSKSSLVGYYPYKNGRAQFYLETDGSYIQSSVSEKPFSEVYPTFDIAAEILKSTSNANVFISQDGLGEFASYFAYGGWGNFIQENATIELTSNDELKELNYSYNYDGEVTSVTVRYSNFGSTSININVDDIIIPSAPTTWFDYDEGVYNQMIEYFGSDYLPYVEAEKGWNVSTGINYMKNYGYYTFTTNNFSSTALRDAFIEEYTNALLTNGFSATNEESDGYKLYSNGVIKVAVTKSSYGTKVQLQIFIA